MLPLLSTAVLFLVLFASVIHGQDVCVQDACVEAANGTKLGVSRADQATYDCYEYMTTLTLELPQ